MQMIIIDLQVYSVISVDRIPSPHKILKFILLGGVHKMHSH